uniref:Uncharacterized protein n=1 Tax=Anguilla anguilla TaxID=7936 RepID=A0A0E9UK93_ANGAN
MKGQIIREPFPGSKRRLLGFYY